MSKFRYTSKIFTIVVNDTVSDAKCVSGYDQIEKMIGGAAEDLEKNLTALFPSWGIEVKVDD